MRGSLRILAMVVAVYLLSGCSTMFDASSIEPSDLYVTDYKEQVAERAEAKRKAHEQQVAFRNQLANSGYYVSEGEEPNFNSVLASDYQSAYARRLYGFNSPSYCLPSSYFALSTNDAFFYASAYDPAFYNVMLSGDQIWVEPKYVTSMFGSWGATNITYGIYSSPWHYGWSFHTPPCYYSWWGYPSYSWYDWNWNICYNPWHYDWWYGGYYPHYGYYPYPPHAPRPPHHRPRPDVKPGYRPITGSGASAGRPQQNLNGSRANSASRYTSPQSNRNYGSSESGDRYQQRKGTTSSGVYRGGSTNNRGSNSSSTTVRGTNSTQQGSRYQGTSTTTNSNYRSGSSTHSRTNSQTRTSGSSYRSNTGSSNSTGGSYRSGSSGGGGSNRGGSRR